MRARIPAIICAAAAVIGGAGCSGSPVRPPPHQTHTSATAPVGTATQPRPESSPGCSTAAADSPRLSGTRTAMVTDPGTSPFGVVVTPDGRWALVALTTSIEVLRIGSALGPVQVRVLPVSASPVGETLTPDGRYLLAASGSGAVVISVARAEQGRPDAVIGTLTAREGGGGAIEVAVSPDGGYAFVTQEDSKRAAVFNLHQALTQGFSGADYVGAIPLGLAPVGMAVSPDGRWLYLTSEGTPSSPQSQQGTLTVVNVLRAETDPAASVVATVAAGCNPVRVIVSADGDMVWVTARASDDLLGFSAAALRTAPSLALRAIVRVGEAPVGLMLVRHGSLIVVADSNRFGVSDATADLSVVNVAAALAGRPAVIGIIPAGMFPREMALEPDGQTLLVTNYMSGQLEAVSVPTLPAT